MFHLLVQSAHHLVVNLPSHRLLLAFKLAALFSCLIEVDAAEIVRRVRLAKVSAM